MIKVIDNFIEKTDIHRLYSTLKHPHTDWYIGGDRTNDNNKRNFFVKSFEGEIEINQIVRNFPELLNIYNKIINTNTTNANYLRKIYFNCVKPMDGSQFHQDYDGISFLIYLNPVWKFWWGSGTKFKTNNFGMKKVIRPKPGRLIIFDGMIPHTSISPNFFMNDFGRLSVVFQFSRT